MPLIHVMRNAKVNQSLVHSYAPPRDRYSLNADIFLGMISLRAEHELRESIPPNQSNLIPYLDLPAASAALSLSTQACQV
jgi:hypothetical protein